MNVIRDEQLNRFQSAGARFGIDAQLTTFPHEVRLSRVLLFGIPLVLGSFGIFCFYWSCMGAALAALSGGERNYPAKHDMPRLLNRLDLDEPTRGSRANGTSAPEPSCAVGDHD